VASSEYDQCIRMGFSQNFLRTPAGSRTCLRKIFITGHPSPYLCTQCARYYVRVDEIDWDVFDEYGREVSREPSLAQKAGFCSSKCAGRLSLEKGAENVEWAAMIALRPDFYQSRQWRELRMDTIKLHGRTCQCCGAAYADTRRIHVDHIKPRYHYPYLALTLSNLQILCDDCNTGKGIRDETDWREK
jgi:hypothetical protein